MLTAMTKPEKKSEKTKFLIRNGNFESINKLFQKRKKREQEVIQDVTNTSTNKRVPIVVCKKGIKSKVSLKNKLYEKFHKKIFISSDQADFCKLERHRGLQEYHRIR